jgi:predicted ATP-grasp superfamily ATP-dependent carboligase
LSALSHDVLIFGASCRAAAFSALRAGLRPRCADYFADRDLAAVCQVDRIDSRQPRRGFTALAETLSASCWFYTGGFENHPAWVEQIARKHRLWGAGALAVRAVRDPIRVAAFLEEQGIPFPAVCRDPLGLPRDGSWLMKPLRSGGGRDIQPLTADVEQPSGSVYFQERIDGPSFSALYIGEPEGARLVGVTEQLLGAAGSPFAYRGNIGPWPIGEALAVKLRRLGNALVQDSGLTGWFGVDYVLRDGNPWPVEINPRYTASVEIHELASGRALLCDHRQACEGAGAQASAVATASSIAERPGVIAKLIVYASGKLTAPEIAFGDDSGSDPFALRPIADVPWAGTQIAAGEPVMTLLAWGKNVADCRLRLGDLEHEWLRRLGAVDG